MRRLIFDDEHNVFRSSIRKFIEREIKPNHDRWVAEGVVPRALWQKAGACGYLCFSAPEEFGGGGTDDFRYPTILAEELARLNCSGPGFGVHSSIVAPYILKYGNEDQKRRWVPAMASGEKILAVAMTEPSAGSDLAAIQTTAVDKGNHFILDGQKTFVTNGINADLILVACKTEPERKQWGVSLLLAERGMDGFTRSKPLSKIGWRAQDTAELFFDNVRIPKENLIGKQGQGFFLMSKELEQERLLIAVSAMSASRAALDWTIAYCKEREAFGQPIGKFQNTRFRLAEMESELTIGQVFIDRCIMERNAETLTAAETAIAKWWATELQQRVINQCLQLHGGYGYMTESAIAQAWMDMRWTPIGGGTNELMKEVIGKNMGF